VSPGGLPTEIALRDISGDGWISRYRSAPGSIVACSATARRINRR
jgi:hypothetical protein